jgi:hypothetical protein
MTKKDGLIIFIRANRYTGKQNRVAQEVMCDVAQEIWPLDYLTQKEAGE